MADTRPEEQQCITAKRILVIQFRQIGDVLLSTPILRALRQHYPQSYIAFLTEPSPGRVLQGNPYTPENVARNKLLQEAMQTSYERVISDPTNILRPWAMDPEKDNTLTCPMCLGVADYLPEEEVFACRRCKARTPLKGFKPKSLAPALD